MGRRAVATTSAATSPRAAARCGRRPPAPGTTREALGPRSVAVGLERDPLPDPEPAAASTAEACTNTSAANARDRTNPNPRASSNATTIPRSMPPPVPSNCRSRSTPGTTWAGRIRAAWGRSRRPRRVRRSSPTRSASRWSPSRRRSDGAGTSPCRSRGSGSPCRTGPRPAKQSTPSCLSSPTRLGSLRYVREGPERPVRQEERGHGYRRAAGDARGLREGEFEGIFLRDAGPDVPPREDLRPLHPDKVAHHMALRLRVLVFEAEPVGPDEGRRERLLEDEVLALLGDDHRPDESRILVGLAGGVGLPDPPEDLLRGRLVGPARGGPGRRGRARRGGRGSRIVCMGGILRVASGWAEASMDPLATPESRIVGGGVRPETSPRSGRMTGASLAVPWVRRVAEPSGRWRGCGPHERSQSPAERSRSAHERSRSPAPSEAGHPGRPNPSVRPLFAKVRGRAGRDAGPRTESDNRISKEHARASS